MTLKKLNSKQRRTLKQMSHHLKPLMQMGKDGASPAFILELLEQLEHHELLKVRILNNCEWEKEAIEQILRDAEITLVQKVGHILTVYKESEEEPVINLPE
ncbi:MAG: ribosome assembly RNA-binding protein YhbY [Acidobacteria bacterium]|nr:MAG: ribosome assembly RNA-binding protein YhbY [Acidobacteriota bacterium]